MFKQKTLWLIALAVLTIAVWLWPHEEQPQVTQVTATPSPTPVPVAGQPAPLVSQAAPSVKPLDEEQGSVPEEVAAMFNETMQLQLGHVAQAYEKTIRYPSYSVPLTAESWDLRHPQSFVDNSLPVQGEEGVEAALSLSKYVIFAGEPLQVTVTVNSKGTLPPLYDLTVDILENQQVVGHIPMQKTQNSETLLRYQSNYLPTQSEEETWGQDLQIRANLSMGQKETLLISPIKYARKNALLLAAKESYPQGADLIIPLEFEVYQAGRYQVRANLYDEGGQAISHLIAKANLSEVDNQLLLKVHSQILRDKQAPGPYLLREFNITKVPGKPGETTKYAASQLEVIKVNGHDLSRYDDTPYRNEQEQARLNFLKHMAGQ